MTRFLRRLVNTRFVMLLVVTTWALTPRAARGWTETVSSGNSSLTLTADDPVAFGAPSDPVALLRTLEWIVDGRRIVVYPSSPSNFLDVDAHRHRGGEGSHIAEHQLHLQGPLLGSTYDYGQSMVICDPDGAEGNADPILAPGNTDTVVGGVVFTVEGGPPGSGRSRLYEKVDIVNRTAETRTLSMVRGLGYRQEGVLVQVAGTTTVFVQGSDALGPSLTDLLPSFAPVFVLPVASFEGLNPLLYVDFNLNPGATLTMITELNVNVIRPFQNVPPLPDQLPPDLPPGFPLP